jgi:hypothetical protein
MMNEPRYMAIREGYVDGAWSAFPSMEMTSEKSRMVIMPPRAPRTTVVPWHANVRPRRSIGIQQSGSGEVPSEICQEIHPVTASHTKVLVRVCGA